MPYFTLHMTSRARTSEFRASPLLHNPPLHLINLQSVNTFMSFISDIPKLDD